MHEGNQGRRLVAAVMACTLTFPRRTQTGYGRTMNWVTVYDFASDRQRIDTMQKVTLGPTDFGASMIDSKPAMDDRFKTGQRKVTGPVSSTLGKRVDDARDSRSR